MQNKTHEAHGFYGFKGFYGTFNGAHCLEAEHSNCFYAVAANVFHIHASHCKLLHWVNSPWPLLMGEHVTANLCVKMHTDFLLVIYQLSMVHFYSSVAMVHKSKSFYTCMHFLSQCNVGKLILWTQVYNDITSRKSACISAQMPAATWHIVIYIRSTIYPSAQTYICQQLQLQPMDKPNKEQWNFHAMYCRHANCLWSCVHCLTAGVFCLANRCQVFVWQMHLTYPVIPITIYKVVA